MFVKFICYGCNHPYCFYHQDRHLVLVSVCDCWCVGRFNGVVRLKEKAPDAITSYMISAFAIDDLYGLGVTEQPTKVSLYLVHVL